MYPRSPVWNFGISTEYVKAQCSLTLRRHRSCLCAKDLQTGLRFGQNLGRKGCVRGAELGRSQRSWPLCEFEWEIQNRADCTKGEKIEWEEPINYVYAARQLGDETSLENENRAS